MVNLGRLAALAGLPRSGMVRRPWPLVFALCVAVVGAALPSALALFDGHPPVIIASLLYLVPIGLATAIGGRLPGLVGLGVSALALDYLFLPPFRHWGSDALVASGGGRVSGWLVLGLFGVVGLATTELVARVRDATWRAREAERRVALLAGASSLLGRSVSPMKALRSVAELAAAAFGGPCIIDVNADGPNGEEMAVAHEDPNLDVLVRRLRGPLGAHAHAGVLAEALAAGRGVVLRSTDEILHDLAADADDVSVLRALGAKRWVVAPLVARERVIGVLAVGVGGARAQASADLELAEDLASRVALAVDGARLFSQEERAREEAQEAAARTERLRAVTDALGPALTPDRTGTVIAEQAGSWFGADRVTVYRMTGEKGMAGLLASRGYPRESLEQLREIDTTLPGPVAEAITLRRPTVIESPDEVPARWPSLEMQHERDRAGLVAPLILEDRVVGVLCLAFDAPRRFDPDNVRLLGTLARQCAQALERARLIEEEQSARAAAEASADRLSLVSRASTLLAAELDDPRAYTRLAELMVERLADLCLIDVRRDDGSLRRVAAVHADPERQGAADLLRDRFVPLEHGQHPVARVVRTGKPELAEEMTEDFLRETSRDGEHFRIIRELGFESFMCLPLSARGRILGALTLVSTDPARRYGEADLAMAHEIARRAGVRIDNARLYSAEQEARRAAEEAGQRLSFLAEASRILSSSLDSTRTLDRVAHLAVPRIADWCAVDVRDEAGRIRSLAVAHVDPEKRALGDRFRAEHPAEASAQTGVANVIRTGRSELIPEVSAETLVGNEDPRLRELVRELGPLSIMRVPMSARGSTFGAITFVSAESGRRFGQPDLELAEDLAGRAAIAVDNARLYQERDQVAQTLQRNLLPPRLPEVPGMDLEGRYHALGSGNEVGGDFFDVFESGDGSWGMVIGDVCGKGPEAAAVMGVVRYTLRAAAMYEDRPSVLLANLNQALRQQVGDERFCTVCYVRVRPHEGRARLTICLAGHPPPIVLRANGTVERVGRPGTILGVFPEVSLLDVVVDLNAEDTIVLFTDGMVDERRGPEFGGEGELQRALASAAGQSVASIAALLDRRITEPGTKPPRDDAAVLVAGVRQPQA